MRYLILLIVALPLFACAAGEGAWQASSIGIRLDNRGVAASSRPLGPTQPVDGLITEVSWRYELNGPTPAGLLVRLCSQTRCVALDGQSGSTRGLADVPAAEQLRFVWEVPGGGRLWPPLNVRSNQVIVNYRQPAKS
ncbi:flagellar protein FlhE [Kosakonia radicincitans DSM 16656]|uniref:flagellar protein FlhE n=1 Tax=Kosakonia TaxID=1330547 RepID=UPI00027307C5|nr:MULTISPECIES: flagellar protein FlhE [Kosakonia]ARD60304.1 flagellar protein FlhE [Kosakonia radicincitans DSM 16656]MDD7997932.1 flagellar protein FlhE [Kosakonia radicincitans]PTA91656.1 flagellar protein FlhE [Kosakonia sp. H7A]